MYLCACMLSRFHCVQLFQTLRTVAHLQPVPLFMEFFRQEYWNGLSCSPPVDFPNPGMEPWSPSLQADALPSEPPGKLLCMEVCNDFPNIIKAMNPQAIKLQPTLETLFSW